MRRCLKKIREGGIWPFVLMALVFLAFVVPLSAALADWKLMIAGRCAVPAGGNGTAGNPYVIDYDVRGVAPNLYYNRYDTKFANYPNARIIPNYSWPPFGAKANIYYNVNNDTSFYFSTSDRDTKQIYVFNPDTSSAVYYNLRFYTGGSPGGGGGGGSGSGSGSSSQERTLDASDVTYIGGANRVLTSIAISQRGWTSAGGVILAPADENHLIDALTVASLAGQEDIPVLLVSNRTVSEEVFTEIQRLGATKVYSVGWLGQTVADQVRARYPGITAEVLQGSTRIETAELIKAKITNPQGSFVIGFSALADAVSAASYAAANGWIIQVAGPDGSFSGQLTAGGGNILGGPALVRDIAGLTRVYGADRYATNIALFKALNYKYDYIYVTDGRTLVDGLTGAPLAAKTDAFILLAPNNDPTGTTLPNITSSTQVVGLGAKK
ncbi:MAG: cell wall-binding repeat-containing protein [Gracilibacteraceae bacterium]|jgi:hypothetical protein|nr:cell wall-binding repeat-containing protein [Gracilibacteraceae bacterium]